MIEPYKILFVHPASSSYAIYLDFKHTVHVNFNTSSNTKGIRRLTSEEFLNLVELEKINLHIPYILSLLNE